MKRLLAHYERIADAPDAIARLRRFVLDLAVRGKLVPQGSNDEPASELLKRIASEKARLVKAGQIRTPKAVPTLSDTPFPLAAKWRWSQIAEIGVLSPRNEAHDDLQASFVPMPLIAAEYGVPHQHEVRPWGEIKKGYTHFANGDVGLAKITPCFENGKSTFFSGLTGGIGSGTTELHIVRPIFLDQKYILIFFKSPHFIETGIPKMTGTAGQKRVPFEYFAYSPFPLPPLAEQHRIVAKVDELMALCDRLEAARTAREATRDRLTAASFARLNAPDPETFSKYSRFALDALPALTARPDQIKQLRQTILNLAVRGKLVPQDPGDEPASELLKRIAAEKARLVQAGRARRQESGPEIDGAAFPITPPTGWALTRLATISRRIHYGYTASADAALKDVRLLRITDIQNNLVDWPSVPGCIIEPNEVDQYSLDKGDILIARTGGTIGKTFLVRDVPVTAVFASYLIRIQGTRHVFDEYLKLFLESPVYWTQLREGARGTGQPNVNGQTLGYLVLSLPPLAEQHRIVARVDELMALCHQLEASLTTADEARSRLLDALLAEALAPAELVDRQAAE